MLPFEKFIGLFSVVRGYNIMMICIAQYLTAIFILSRQPLRQVLLDPRHCLGRSFGGGRWIYHQCFL